MNPSRTLLFVIGLFLSALLLASLKFKIDQVVRTQAKLEPQGRAFVIQSRYPGTVRRVEVALGAELERDQVAFEIDPEGANVDADSLARRLAIIRANRERLAALIAERPLMLPPDLDVVLRSEQRLLYLNLLDDLKRIRAEAQQESEVNRLEREEVNTLIASANSQVQLVREELKVIEPLVELKIESEVRLIQLKRSLAELRGEVQSQQARLQRLEQQNALIELTKQNEVERLKASWQQELVGSQTEETQLAAELEKAQQRSALGVVKSPFEGVVAKLLVSRAGAVVREGDALAELVPLDAEYIAVARLAASDISNVSIGQAARLTLSTYDFSDYGHIDVSVTEIAQNLTEPEGAEPYYEVQLAVQRPEFSKTGQQAQLVPGMLGQVEFLKDPISLFEYVTKPIRRARSVALTEY